MQDYPVADANQSSLYMESIMPGIKPQLDGSHILLAEDNELFQDAITRFLEQAGAKVWLAGNGEEALDLMRHLHFDCVLMDVQMPVMDGLEATRRIRSTNAFAKIPVIAITGDASNASRQRCLAAGMDDFIPKSSMPGNLLDELGKWLPGREL